MPTRIRERAPAALLLASLLASLLTSACAADPAPTRDLALRRVVLYQNGIGYFERSGALREDRLKLRLRSHEIDDVLKTLVVIESGASKNAASKPSTVTVLLPSSAPKPTEGEEPEPTWLDVVLSPRPTRELSIAYAVPTAAWKAAYRVVLPDREKSAAAPKSAGGSALLQAWALIDNVSDEDWVGINLTLATGAPMSFETDLRSPRFIKRPGASYDFGESAPTGPVYAERVAQADQDADGIKDSIDACPNERGTPNADPSKSGCPQFARVIVSSSDIRIMSVIQFDKDSSQIKPISFPILDQVAQVLRENPQIRALAIEGHASSGEKDPWGLSARRAAEVKKQLIQRGVTTELKTGSTGETKPIANNATEEGRTRNRRVEFHIERTETDEDRKIPAGRATASALSQTAPAQTAIRDLAGAVRYDITHPVTIPKSSTTLVTIINEYIPGEEIFLFRPDPNMPGSHRHPMRAARIENKSGFGLQAGPVAVFGGGTFVGEGVLAKLNPGDTAMIPYGIDSSTSVEVTAKEASRPVRLIALARGQMTVEDSRIVTTSYSIAAGIQAPARIFLRHARGPGFTALDLPPGTETTPDAYLVPIPIQEKRSSTLAIEERKPERHVLDILATDGERLAAYLHHSRLRPDMEKRIREVVDLRNEVGRITRDISTIRTQLNDLGQQSSELRENLQAIEKTPRASALQQRLMDRLGAATKQMDDLSGKLSTATVDLAEARAKLAESLRDFRIEEASDNEEKAGARKTATP